LPNLGGFSMKQASVSSADQRGGKRQSGFGGLLDPDQAPYRQEYSVTGLFACCRAVTALRRAEWRSSIFLSLQNILGVWRATN
jgi:hypothetical protein